MESKIFPNAAFGYWKVTVERPLRLSGSDPDRPYLAKEIKALKENAEPAEDGPLVIRKIHRKGATADPLRGLLQRRSPASRRWWSTSPTPSCATRSRSRCLRTGGSRRS